ncbi:MAG: L,D-transpeptidase family protein [Desulfobacterales bacterium]|nr:L,D-transpeptidase family protein [Desulfobacterales bacterium]
MVRLLATMVCFSLLSAPAAQGSTTPPDDTIARKLQARIAAAQTANRLACAGELVCGIAELPRFYAQRNYRPAWIKTEDGAFAVADEMVQQVEDARYDGLPPQHYHLDSIRSLLQTAKQQATAGRPPDPDVHADLEFLLTDAFLMLASHLRAGRVNPETLENEWLVQIDSQADLAQVLERAIESRRINEALDGFRPPHPEYTALRKALKNHRTRGEAAEWLRLPEKTSWERGQSGAIADLLRERLRLSGDLPQAPEGAGADADVELVEGLRRFQQRHGLEADGRMGPQTLQALNVSLEERIRQVELNLERWRWLPHDLGARHIRVNVPQFDLAVIEDGQEVLRMRVVVGRHYRRTPVFSSYLGHLVFNPDWNIPTRIAVEDILPKARRDSAYLRREKIRVFESWDRSAPELDPDRIDWTAVAGQGFRYKFKKDPGPHNDLGRIKFAFPNKFAVYLHDTPSKRLFDRSMRGFSSGCIRIEKPIDLAEYALRDSPGWSRDAVIAAIDSGANRTVRLPHPIALHLIYMTAGVTSEGRLRFWPDIYQRDPTLDRVLQKKPPRKAGNAAGYQDRTRPMSTWTKSDCG